MPTQLAAAKASRITDEIRRVAEDERLEPEQVRSAVAAGHIVIPFNVNHPDQRPIGIGHGLSTKTNANMGTSSVQDDHDHEMAKLEAALEYGAESVMDLSTCEHCDGTRKMFIDASDVMVGTVPIYQAARKRAGSFLDMTADELFDAIEETARDGVDYITVHCGVTKRTVSAIDEAEKKRVCGIVSKGGSHHAAMIRATGEENPLYEQFDRLLEICREYDVTLSLGDGLRPGAIADATDSGQIEELLVIGGLQQAGARRRRAGDDRRARPRAARPDQGERADRKSRSAMARRFYVLGPLTCDTAPGYDHITGAIGGAIAAAAGVDMLCYITPAEHLRLPTVEDVIDGVMATPHRGALRRRRQGHRRCLATQRRDVAGSQGPRLGVDVRARPRRQEAAAHARGDGRRESSGVLDVRRHVRHQRRQRKLPQVRRGEADSDALDERRRPGAERPTAIPERSPATFLLWGCCC